MRRLSLIFYCLIISQWLFAQVITNHYPDSRVSSKGMFGKATSIRTITLPLQNNETLIKRGAIPGDKVAPFQFAAPLQVDISPTSSGTWENGENGTLIWRIKFTSGKAFSTSIDFDKFILSDDAEMYIYNGEGTMVTGPVTSAENNPEQVWGSAIYAGESLIVELKVPERSKNKCQLHINNFSHGYRNLFKTEKTFGASGACNINVLCPLVATWQNERNAVALVLNASSSEHCSGSLIANTCNLNIPYFLTADHCYTAPNAGAVSNWKFIFQYWSPNCTPSTNGSRSVLFNGSSLRANSAASDFALLQLRQTPSINSGLAYAGWSRNTTSITTLTGIHHPSGDVMKISQVTSAPVKSAYLGGAGTNHWEMNWGAITNGVTEGGSSGSPLFNQDHRIIGQLHGGYSSCTSTDLRDWYGAFDVSWTGGGTNATRLSNWLDPSGSNAMTTNTILASALPVYTITGSGSLCSATGSYSVNAPVGATVTWQSSDPGSATITSSGNPATLTRQTPSGSTIITATITINGCVYTPSLGVTIGGTQLAGMTLFNGVGGTEYWCSSNMGNGYILEWTNGNISTATVELRSFPSMTLLSTVYGASGTVYLTPPPPVPPAPGWYSVLATHYNACGEMSTAGYIVESKNCNFSRIAKDSGMFQIRVSPNPAKSSLQVVIIEDEVQSGLPNTTPIQLTLREASSGLITRQWNRASNQKQLLVDLTGIKKGNYLLTVQKGTNRQSKQIIIE